MLGFHSIHHLPSASLTRLAPTPSGFLHLGNLLSFAITAHFAKRTGAKIHLRIDDLDRERAQSEYIEDIFQTLKFLDIPWHSGPANTEDFQKRWSQYNRMGDYEAALKQLEEGNHVFACNCSRSQLAALGNGGIYPGTCLSKKLDLHTPGVQWRLKTRPGRVLRINRLGAPVLKATLPPLMQNFVVRKKDGVAAYQLASLVDDVNAGTDLIVRGVDLWPSTWAQLYLAETLSKECFLKVAFVHHPLLQWRDGTKLSKSAGATSIQYLRNQGMTREGIYTEVAKMLGSRKRCHNWQELATLMEKHFAP